MSRDLAATVLALSLLAGVAPAQLRIVLRVGDAVPGAGKITGIDTIDVNPHGEWSARVRTDDPLAHTVLYRYGEIVAKVGDAPSMLGGAQYAALEPPTVDFFWVPTFIARLSGSSAAQAVMWGQHVQFLTGQSATVYTNELPPGSTWRRFDGVQFPWADAGYLLVGAIDDPVTTAFDRSLAGIVWHGGSPGNIIEFDPIAVEGELAPGLARRIESVRAGADQARVGRYSSPVIWSCDLDGSTSDDGCVYRTIMIPAKPSELLAREGSPSPVAGRNWGALEDHAVDIEFYGAWTLRGRLDGSDPSNDEVLVRGTEVVAREGDVLAATAPYPLASLGQGRGALDENQRVLWFGAWDDPATPGLDEALFKEHVPVVRTGQTNAQVTPLADIESGSRTYSYDPKHGRFVAFLGELADGTRGAFLLDLAAVEVYCTAKPSSLGVLPQIAWDGQPPSATLGSGFRIEASKLPAQSLAVFFYGTHGPSAVPFHGGTLCVEPPLRRALAKFTGGTTGATGSAKMDFNVWIALGLHPELVAGARVHLQVWFRDSGFAPPDDVGLTAGLQFQIGP